MSINTQAKHKDVIVKRKYEKTTKTLQKGWNKLMLAEKKQKCELKDRSGTRATVNIN